MSTRMFSQRPDNRAGRLSQPMRRLKNESRTRGQPGAEVTANSSTAANTTVDSSATSVERRARACR